jgi:tetratricopeptide (TPR) repeat protein
MDPAQRHIVRFGLLALSGLFGVLIPDAIFTSSMIVFMLIFYFVWMFPEGEYRADRRPVSPLIALTLFSILVGIGAAWIIWKIEPYFQAVVHSYNNDWMESVNQLEIAISRDPDNPYYLYTLGFATGEIACESGEGYSKPIELYSSALEIYPTWDIGHVNLASMYAEMGKFTLATSHMAKAIETYSFNPLYTCIIGDYYVQSNEADEALNAYTNCIKAYPEILDTSYWRGNSQKTSMENKIIEQVTISANEMDVDLFQQSRIYLYTGYPTLALELIMEYLDESPSDIDAKIHYINIMDKMGILSDSIYEIDDLVHANPANKTLWFFLGKAALTRGDFSKAEQALEISHLRGPGVRTKILLGILYDELGEVERAESAFRDTIKIGNFSIIDFSRHVAGRWPIRGVYNSCVPGIYSNKDYIEPIMKAGIDLEDENCFLAACLYNMLDELRSPAPGAHQLLGELPCYQDFDSSMCLQRP